MTLVEVLTCTLEAIHQYQCALLYFISSNLLQTSIPSLLQTSLVDLYCIISLPHISTWMSISYTTHYYNQYQCQSISIIISSSVLFSTRVIGSNSSSCLLMFAYLIMQKLLCCVLPLLSLLDLVYCFRRQRNKPKTKVKENTTTPKRSSDPRAQIVQFYFICFVLIFIHNLIQIK